MGLLTKLSEQYNDLWRAIIRPPRDCYSIYDLGPTTFPLRNKVYERTDLTLLNERGMNVVCSHFQPIRRQAKRLPCVVYLHGNCSSRMESLGCLHILLPLNVTVLGFDFSGSGISDGEYVSLGWHERDDLAMIIKYLRSLESVSSIGLWGRSMGAVTALLHCDRDPSIAGLVLDSPFSSLRKLAEELTEGLVRWKIPRFLVNVVMGWIRNTVLQKAQFDIDYLMPIEHVAQTFMPALFIAAKEDKFIRMHHSTLLAKEYAGDTNIIYIEGNHNSVRPKYLMDSVAIFFYTVLQCHQIDVNMVPNPRSPDNHLACFQIPYVAQDKQKRSIAKSIDLTCESGKLSLCTTEAVSPQTSKSRTRDTLRKVLRRARSVPPGSLENYLIDSTNQIYEHRHSRRNRERNFTSTTSSKRVDPAALYAAVQAVDAPNDISSLLDKDYDQIKPFDMYASNRFTIHHRNNLHDLMRSHGGSSRNIELNRGDTDFSRLYDSSEQDDINEDDVTGDDNEDVTGGVIDMRGPDLPCHFELAEGGEFELVGDVGLWEEELILQQAIRMSLQDEYQQPSSKNTVDVIEHDNNIQ